MTSGRKSDLFFIFLLAGTLLVGLMFIHAAVREHADLPLLNQRAGDCKRTGADRSVPFYRGPLHPPPQHGRQGHGFSGSSDVSGAFPLRRHYAGAPASETTDAELEIMSAIEKQRHIIDFMLSSLWRRKGKNLSLLLVYTFVIFLLGLGHVLCACHQKRSRADTARRPRDYCPAARCGQAGLYSGKLHRCHQDKSRGCNRLRRACGATTTTARAAPIIP